MTRTMHHHRTKTAAVAFALVAMAFVAGGTIATPVEPELQTQGVSVPTQAPGLPMTPLWETRTDFDGGSDNVGAIAVDPIVGTTVYVTGDALGDTRQWLTVAYDGLTGEELWQATLEGPGGSSDYARAIAVSPDGLSVYVTGSLRETSSTADNRLSVAAYNAATGIQLWATSLTTDRGVGWAVTATHDAVFVAGEDRQPAQERRTITTLALDPISGDILWEARFDGGGPSTEHRANAIATDGDRVYVTGRASIDSTEDFIVLAYDVNGDPDIPQEPLWSDYLNPGDAWDYGAAIAVEDGIVVFTGRTSNYAVGATGIDFLTVAYDTATGNRLWLDIFDYAGTTSDWANDIVIDNGVAYAIGNFRGETFNDRFKGVVAYELNPGNYENPPLWHTAISGPGEAAWGNGGSISGILGNTLVVFGEGYRDSCCRVLITTALNVTTGSQHWQTTYDYGGSTIDVVGAVSPLGDRTYVAGSSSPEGTWFRDWAVMGYLTP